MLEESIKIFDEGLETLKTTQNKYILAILILFAVLFFTVDIELTFPSLALIVCFYLILVIDNTSIYIKNAISEV